METSTNLSIRNDAEVCSPTKGNFLEAKPQVYRKGGSNLCSPVFPSRQLKNLSSSPSILMTRSPVSSYKQREVVILFLFNAHCSYIWREQKPPVRLPHSHFSAHQYGIYVQF